MSEENTTVEEEQHSSSSNEEFRTFTPEDKTVLSSSVAREKVLKGEALQDCFVETLDLEGLTLDQPVDIRHSKIKHFKANEAQFEKDIFLEKVHIVQMDMDRATVLGKLQVLRSKFKNWMSREADFQGEVQIEKTDFTQKSHFRKSQFHKKTVMRKCLFDNFDFSQCQCGNVLLMNDSKFTGQRASFNQAKIKGNAWVLERVEARCRLDFTEIQTEGRIILQGAYLVSADFARAKLAKVVMTNVRFQSQCSFAEAVFTDELSMNRSEFKKLILDRVTLAKGVDAHLAKFTNDLVFTKAECGPCNFKDAEFKGKVFMGASKYEGNINFKGARLFQKCSLKGSRVSGELILEETRFQDEINLSFLEGEGEIKAPNSHFSGGLDCFSIKAKSKCLFTNSRFYGKVNFVKAQFDMEADFRDSEFHNETTFSGCLFIHNGYFVRCRFKEVVFFNNTRFERSAFFKHVRIEHKASFHNASIARVLAWGDAELNNVNIRRHQIEGKLANESEGRYVQARLEYNLLQRNFEQRGQHDEADWAYLQFKRMDRMAKAQNAWDVVLMRKKKDKEKENTDEEKENAPPRMGYFSALGQVVKSPLERVFLDWGCGYGMKPFNITVLMVTAILMFAAIYASFPGEIVFEGSEINRPLTSVVQEAHFFDYLYFSVTTFTTMGFGDTHPHHYSLIKYVVALEAFLGIFLMALFVGTMTRKIIR